MGKRSGAAEADEFQIRQSREQLRSNLREFAAKTPSKFIEIISFTHL